MRVESKNGAASESGCTGLYCGRPTDTILPMTVIANGEKVAAPEACTLEGFLIQQGLLPRSVVVEHNGEAVAPSEFADRGIADGDRLEIVRIVAGG